MVMGAKMASSFECGIGMKPSKQLDFDGFSWHFLPTSHWSELGHLCRKALPNEWPANSWQCREDTPSQANIHISGRRQTALHLPHSQKPRRPSGGGNGNEEGEAYSFIQNMQREGQSLMRYGRREWPMGEESAD